MRSRRIGFDLPSRTVLLVLLARLILAIEVKPAYFCPLDPPKVGQSSMNHVWHVGI